MIVLFDHSGAILSQASLYVVISQIEIAPIRTTASALSSALAKESTADRGDEG